jgi:hypothetical protein
VVVSGLDSVKAKKTGDPFRGRRYSKSGLVLLSVSQPAEPYRTVAFTNQTYEAISEKVDEGCRAFFRVFR